MPFPARIDLSSLGSAGFITQGASDRDYAGFSVSNAGDINGDGYDDLIVGAPVRNGSTTEAGHAYVVFGKAGGSPNIDLGALAPADGFVIQGDAAGDEAGFSVSAAGDINGDGYHDLIVGAPSGDDGGSQAGETYVIFGKASGFTDVDLGALAPADGFIIQGDSAGDESGFSVSGAGDVNGDGYDDLIVGAPFDDDGGSDAGKAYVIFGKAGGFADIDLGALAPADGFAIQGNEAGDNAGWSVSNAGDVNGDGYDDLIVGAVQGAFASLGGGEAYVVFGKAGGFTDIDLGALAPADGFTIQGDSEDDFAGASVASAGDINGDGYDDLIVGAPFGDDGGSYAGEAYVIFGKAGGFTDIDLGALDPADGFVIVGEANDENVGYSVSGAGDVNGDGFDDLIIGAPFGDDGGTNAGEVYVIFGKAGGFGNIDLGALDAADGFVVQGDAAGDGAGQSVSGAGDINGDGFDDLVVGAPFGDDGDSEAGEAYVVFGRSSASSAFPAIFEIADDLNLASGATIIGGYGGGYLGWSVSDAGDVNGDGIADVIVGEPNSSFGTAYVVYGKLGGIGTIDTTALDLADGFTITGEALGDLAAWSVSGAGDINGDGVDDLIVGATQAYSYGTGYTGRAYVVFGQDGGLGPVDVGALGAGEGFTISGAADFDYAGWSVSGAGDVNGDGFADLIVGASQNEDGGSLAGAAYVIFGTDGGFTDIDLAALDPSQGIVIAGAPGGLAGFGVSAAGDVNGDGVDDLLVGAPFETGSGDHFGSAYLIFGRAESDGGLDDIDLATLDPADGVQLVGLVPGAGPDVPPLLAGFSVSGAGDVNGDGFDDLLIGAPLTYSACGCFYYGAAYVVFGAADGLDTIDLTSLAPDEGFSVRGFGLDEYLGVSVSGAGDVNGDGFADIIVGAPATFFYGFGGAGPDAGGAYVVFGKADGFGPISFVDGVSPDDGFFIAGVAEGDATGQSVSAAGDVNGDGFDDLIVGAPYADPNYGVVGADAGAAYIIYGRGVVAVDDALETFEDTPVSGSLFDDNGSGAEIVVMATPEIIEVNGSSGNVGTQTTLASGALLTVNADGTYTYDPDGAFDETPDTFRSGASNTPATDSFTYTLAGGGTATVTLTIFGVDSDDTLIGTPGPDSLRGGIGIDDLSGLGGNDTLSGGPGDDDMAGGPGNDIYAVDSLDETVLENGGEGNDRVLAYASYRLTAGAEVELLAAADQLGTAALNLAGNAFAQTIIGNEGANNLQGMGGNDVLRGRGGNDILGGGAGDDVMFGGAGDDAYAVDSPNDQPIEIGGEGNDRVLTSSSYRLGVGVSVELLSAANQNGSDPISLTGNELANNIQANEGNNMLNGGAGNDTLWAKGGDDVLDGGAGSDLLIGGAGADNYVFRNAFGASNIDLVLGFSSGTDQIWLDDAIFIGLAPGALPAGAFHTGTAAQDADDRIIYNPATGILIFDSNGTGPGGVVHFATLAGAPPLDASDFTVI